MFKEFQLGSTYTVSLLEYLKSSGFSQTATGVRKHLFYQLSRHVPKKAQTKTSTKIVKTIAINFLHQIWLRKKSDPSFWRLNKAATFWPHPRSLEDDPTTGRSFPLPVAETSQPSPLPPFFLARRLTQTQYMRGRWESENFLELS